MTNSILLAINSPAIDLVGWTNRLGAAALGGGLALLVAWMICVCCQALSPRLQCWLWRLAYAKLLVGLVWVVPLAIPLLPPEAVEPANQASITFPRFTDQSPADLQSNANAIGPFAATPSFDASTSSTASADVAAEFAAANEISWREALIPLWLLGVGAMTVLTLRQWLKAAQLVRASLPAGSALAQQCAELASEMHLRSPRVWLSNKIESPLLVGVWQPALVFPAAIDSEYTSAEISLMVRHELAHLKRKDLLWNWLPVLARVLFFFHPLVWLFGRSWTDAQESACDELLIQRTGIKAGDFGRLLLKLNVAAANGSSQQLLNLGMAASGVLGTYKNLERRILAMSRIKSHSRRSIFVAAALLSATAVLVIAPWRLVAQEANGNTGRQNPWTMRLGEGEYRFGRANCLLYAPDGSYLACFAGNFVTLWNPQTAEKLRELQFPGERLTCKAAAISADGRRMAIVGAEYVEKQWRGYIAALEIATGRVLLHESIAIQPARRQEEIRSVAFSPDGQLLLTGSGSGAVALWDLQSGKAKRSWETPVNPMNDRFLHIVAFSPDGRRIASGGVDGVIRFWDWQAEGDEPVLEFAAGYRIASLLFLEQGQQLLARTIGKKNAGGKATGETKIWDARSGELIRSIGETEALLEGPAVVSADERLLAVADLDRIRVYELAAGKKLLDLSDSGTRRGLDSMMPMMAVSANGERLVARGDDGEVRIWDLKTGERLFEQPQRHKTLLRLVDVSPDGKTLLTADEHMFRTWDAATGEPLRTVPLPRPDRTVRNLMYARFTPDGRSVLICGGIYEPTGGGLFAATVEVWDATTGDLRMEFGELPWYATTACFSADGESAAVYCGYGSSAAGAENQVFAFSLKNGRIAGRLASEGELYVQGLRFREGGNVIETVQSQGGLIAWDLQSQERSEPRTAGFLDKRGDLEIAPNQEQAMFFNYEDKKLTLFNLDSLETVREFDTEQLAGDHLRFSPSGKLVAAKLNSKDREDVWIRVWETETGRIVKDFKEFPAHCYSLAFFPDDRRLLCGLGDATAIVLQVQD